MVSRVDFIQDLAQLEVMYVTEDYTVFEAFLEDVCAKYHFSIDALEDELAKRMDAAVRLLNERPLADVELYGLSFEDDEWPEDSPWDDE